MVRKTVLLCVILFFAVHFPSCANHFGSAEITKPDEHKKIYEAKEKYILKSIAAVVTFEVVVAIVADGVDRQAVDVVDKCVVARTALEINAFNDALCIVVRFICVVIGDSIV